MTSKTEQSPLLDPDVIEEIEPEEPAEPVVWVVASRKMDSPHPYVEAVYDNESAAKEHSRELRANAFGHDVVAWDVFECPIHETVESGVFL